MKKRVAVILLIVAAAAVPRPAEFTDLRIGSKLMTESVILGEMIRILAEDQSATAHHVRELGGTRLVFEALQNGEIDLYVEYTGTLTEELFSEQDIQSTSELRAALSEFGIAMSEPLGFNNTYALGMLENQAEQLRIRRISDLPGHSGLRMGFTNEFMERDDGWPGLSTTYGLAPQSVTGLDHDVAYRQLQLGVIDVTDVYTTEARIDAFGIRVLEDDRGYFPRYDAVILYRQAAAEDYDSAISSILRLQGQIDAAEMIDCNRQAQLDGVSESRVAAEFLQTQLGVKSEVVEPSRPERILGFTFDHLDLVRRSLLPAILIGIPLGVFATRNRWFGHTVLAVTGIIQTIPSLALLVLLMPLAARLELHSVGTGSATAVLALFLYSLLPIVRGTHTGLTSIDPALIESAEVLNLPKWYRLFEIELPLASRSILSGIKTATVLNIGFATLGALIGAGGYGQPILSGIRLVNDSLILEGAVPAAVMAVAAQLGFDFIERFAVPSGLRLDASHSHT